MLETIKHLQSEKKFSYERRRPEETTLYQCIIENINTVFQNLESDGRNFPAYVRKEFDSYLDCGILAKGFLRAKCSSCGHEKLVAFSCKKRGFCPSCGGRRMSEGAAHLVDNVIPEVPIRQWVLSFPYHLRYLFAYQKKALHHSLQIMLRVISRYYIKKGEQQHGFKGKTGAITLIQRFGGHLNLNPHFHVIFLDGVYDEEGNFFRVRPPTDYELGEIILRIKERVLRSLEKKEWISGSYVNFETDNLYGESPLLSEVYQASIKNRLYYGVANGKKTEQIGKLENSCWVELKGKLCVSKDSFDLHANVMIPGHDLKGKERLVRYVLRPSLSKDRLIKRDDGDYEYHLKRRWSNGTEKIKLSGEELVIRLISLIPPPRMNLVRYFGVLGSNSSLRRKVVKRTERKTIGKKTCRYIEWAKLLKRVFKIDVTRCGCGGELRIVTGITDPLSIRPILQYLGMSLDIPEPMAARGPPNERYSFF